MKNFDWIRLSLMKNFFKENQVLAYFYNFRLEIFGLKLLWLNNFDFDPKLLGPKRSNFGSYEVKLKNFQKSIVW